MVELPKGVTLRHTPGGTPVLRVHYSADPDRDEAWAKTERAKYSSQGAWDREQNIIHEAGGGERLFAEIFDRWLESKILVDPLVFQLPPNWKMIAGFDHGKANPTAALVAAIDFDGNLWCVSEYYQPGLSPREHAQNLRQLRGFVEAYALSDPSIFYASQAQANGIYRAIASLYADEGIRNLVSAPLVAENLGMERITAHWLDLDRREPSLRILCPRTLRNIEQPQFGICNRGCPNLIWELRRARRMELSAAQMTIKNPTEKIVDKDNHIRDCLFGGSLITTADGERTIDSIHVGDLVLTRKGYRRVLAAWMTHRNAELYELETSDGRKLKATGKHRIWTENRGFVRLDQLLDDDILVTCGRSESTEFPSNGSFADESIDDIQTAQTIASGTISEHTPKGRFCCSTARRGSTLSGQFQPGTMSLFGMAIQPIWSRTIFNACLAPGGNRSQENVHRLRALPPTCAVCRSWLSRGIDRLKDGLGIATMAEKVLKLGSRGSEHARSAVRLLEPFITVSAKSFALRHAGVNGAMLLAGTTSGESVVDVGRNSSSTATRESFTALGHARVLRVRRAGSADVYNLTVDGEHEYFANGILVANCLKYIVLSMPEPTRKSAHMLAVEAIKDIPASDPTSRMIFYNQALEKNAAKPVVLGRRGRYNAFRSRFRRP